ncbi:MAG TPA: heme-binding domain-containing protein [Acidobacteriaceae bacterium]|nr:heme-binding domain-containing protein [Acidobacteriaceae bacterium]
MSNWRLLGWSTVLAAILSLLLARIHPFGSAGLYSRSISGDPIPAQAAFPASVRALLNQKCVDCHSSQARPPLYGRFAPISWLLERDIVRARSEMDLSHWASYTPQQQDVFKSKILHQAKSGNMPLLPYRFIHWTTRITPADIQVLTAWANGAAATGVTAEATLAGDPIRGKAVFEKRCTGCHALTTDREGPRLQGVVGRPAASIPNFPYSTALRQTHIVWTEESLDRWLTDPDSFIPNSNMDFRVPGSQERKDLIVYLRATVPGR